MEVDAHVPEQTLLKRDLAVLAKAEELKARQEKANKRAKAKQKYGTKEEINEEDKENEALPTQPDALPRFPKPVQPVAPSQRELDDLLVSHDLRHATLVDRSQSVPITDIKLSQQTLDRLAEMKVDKFFAVQSAVLPVLLENKKLYTTRERPRDICVSAPTGSGKTLSYVIPVVEALRGRVVTRLRALVVLPTRELVMQVREVFEQFCKGTGLKVAAATGQHSFSSEQNALVDDHDHDLQGGSSKVDILVVTPGRLMDHLKSTRNFTLQHLRFLIIDEADRLLSQNFNDWLKVLISTIEDREGKLDELATRDAEETRDETYMLETDALAPQLVSSHYPLLESSETRSSITQKLLFSATLTRDPARISALNLHKPVYIAVVDKTASVGENEDETAARLLESDRKFALPETLTENMIVTRTSDKALALFYLLHTVKVRNTLCFTKSVESAARLVMLVDAFNAEYAKQAVAGSVDHLRIAHYSSELGPGQRKEVMESFKKGDIHILVCSDIAARGLDIPSIENVVNYDVPVDMRKYVHRVGRTARAGRSGTAWSLVETQEAKYFKTLLSEAGHLAKVHNLKVKRDDLEPYKDAFGVSQSFMIYFANAHLTEYDPFTARIDAATSVDVNLHGSSRFGYIA
ncbi:P-loop containing nucleoside triphosphate hydrolase protein [Cystobasidium minutum MCA 4210]|uniref:P-loop containing nucleoside triphosphate hydrolase protein n=1 Tax=Cystobasidium minutum MCA 4210 TaxID=1397322 RepID=UPI0034CD990A|eukprot:jgi/Rhomi1/146893/e_gw1.7.73.1